MNAQQNEILYQELQMAFRKMKQAHGLPQPLEGSHQITPGEGFLLHAIIKKTEHGTKLRPADLADDRDMSPQALSPILRKLENHGMITRRVSNSDRRVSYIESTEKGRSYSAHINSFFEEQMRGLVAYLGEKDTRELVRILGKVRTYIDEQHTKGDHPCPFDVDGKEETAE